MKKMIKMKGTNKISMKNNIKKIDKVKLIMIIIGIMKKNYKVF